MPGHASASPPLVSTQATPAQAQQKPSIAWQKPPPGALLQTHISLHPSLPSGTYTNTLPTNLAKAASQRLPHVHLPAAHRDLGTQVRSIQPHLRGGGGGRVQWSVTLDGIAASSLSLSLTLSAHQSLCQRLLGSGQRNPTAVASVASSSSSSSSGPAAEPSLKEVRTSAPSAPRPDPPLHHTPHSSHTAPRPEALWRPTRSCAVPACAAG